MYFLKFIGKILLSYFIMSLFVIIPGVIGLIIENILLKMGLFIIAGLSFIFWFKSFSKILENHQKERKFGIYADNYDETQSLAYKLRKYSGLSEKKYKSLSMFLSILFSLWLWILLIGFPGLDNFFPIKWLSSIFILFYPFIPISIFVAYNKGWSKDVEFSFLNKVSIIVEILGFWGLVIAIPMFLRFHFLLSKDIDSGRSILFLDSVHYGYFFGVCFASILYVIFARLLQVFLKIEENTRTSNDSSKQNKIVQENTEGITDNYEGLEKLFNLKEKGIITDEEFEKKKTQILEKD